MAGHLLHNFSHLVTSDRDEAIDMLGTIWEKHSVAVTRGRYHIRWHHAGLQRVSLDYVAHPCALRVVCDGPLTDVFRVSFHRSGRNEQRINGRCAVSTPETAVLFAPGQEIRLETGESQSLLMLNLEGESVRQLLHRRFRTIPPFEEWASELSLDSKAVEGMRSFSMWLAEELNRPDNILTQSPRVIASLEGALLAMFVECLVERYPDARSAGDAYLEDAQLRRIEEWIDAHLDDAIGIEDILARFGVTPLALQRGFRRLRGCSPVQALIERRLDRARTVLQMATPATSVTDVAADLGFFHFGRFAVRYRQRFGEKPSETLARSRCRPGINVQ